MQHHDAGSEVTPIPPLRRKVFPREVNGKRDDDVNWKPDRQSGIYAAAAKHSLRPDRAPQHCCREELIDTRALIVTFLHRRTDPRNLLHLEVQNAHRDRARSEPKASPAARGCRGARQERAGPPSLPRIAASRRRTRQQSARSEQPAGTPRSAVWIIVLAGDWRSLQERGPQAQPAALPLGSWGSSPWRREPSSSHPTSHPRAAQTSSKAVEAAPSRVRRSHSHAMQRRGARRPNRMGAASRRRVMADDGKERGGRDFGVQRVQEQHTGAAMLDSGRLHSAIRALALALAPSSSPAAF
ncbi:hypothetical protein PSPO01_03519 [Paraphaeosphaeria sporulosa]